MLSKTEKMSLFIRDFEALRSAKRAERLERMSAFLVTFGETHWRLRSERVADFNIFSLLKVQRDEVRHSRFLAWLLDAGAGHGQGSRFLEVLLELCGLDIPSEVLCWYHVRTEFSGSESTIDIAVYRRGEFLIYLENKVFSPEGLSQIDREFHDMRRRGLVLRIPEERQSAVFLTPTGRRPTSGDATHWHTISYDQIAAGFSKLLPSITSAKVRTVLSDWIDTISTFGGSDERVL